MDLFRKIIENELECGVYLFPRAWAMSIRRLTLCNWFAISAVQTAT